ncbi:Fc.00g071710.m01.CDS01 [Cosmosporella sp. VM-42]
MRNATRTLHGEAAAAAVAAADKGQDKDRLAFTHHLCQGEGVRDPGIRPQSDQQRAAAVFFE